MAVTRRRQKLSAPPPHSQPRDLKQRVFACINKLGDRDTQAMAVAELEEIAAGLSPAAVPSFLSCLHIPDAASAKAPVRTHCVRLLSLLSRRLGAALAPSLPKMLAAVLRRLRDPDSAVRSACVDAVAAMAAEIAAAAPFSSAILKPLSAALFTEQDSNAQIGAALCLAAAIDAAADPEPPQLQRLVPKLVKLLKCDSFKAKPALLALVGSVIAAGGASSSAALRNLVPCMAEFVSSEDWAARKAAAEAFVKMAVVERDMLSEFKPSCLKKFENRRYDKVKAVRDTMNRMVEAWKEVPDVTGEVSPPPKSQSSSKENVSERPFPISDCETPCTEKTHGNARRLPSSISSFTAANRRRTVLQSKSNIKNMAMVGKPYRDTPSDTKIERAGSQDRSREMVSEDDHKRSGENLFERSEHEKSRRSMSEIKRALFNRNSDEKLLKVGGFRSGSRVVPSYDENTECIVPIMNKNDDIQMNVKDREDLSSIRKQLIQIENQQSSLLDLVQRFMGSSQSGMRALETRVHGLERALDDISYDLAVSTGRISNRDASGTTCCMLPGAEFLSSKFWRRTDSRNTAAGFSSARGIPSLAGLQHTPDGTGNVETLKPVNQRFLVRNGRGLIVNPLAEIRCDSLENVNLSSSSFPGNASTNLHAVGT